MTNVEKAIEAVMNLNSPAAQVYALLAIADSINEVVEAIARVEIKLEKIWGS